MRLDHELVARGLAETRTKAQERIEAKVVYVNGELARKSSQEIKESDLLEVKEINPYVSRGALKLEAALDRFQVSLKDARVVDVGASTGGFTQVALDRGACCVYSVDVGRDQLADKLRKDERVVNWEGVNVRYGLPEEMGDVDWAVIDVSFISLKLILPAVMPRIKKGAIVLYKPQFEVGPEGLGKNGVVKSEGHRLVALGEFKEWVQHQAWLIQGQTESPVLGKEGNKEYLLYLTRQSDTIR